MAIQEWNPATMRFNVKPDITSDPRTWETYTPQQRDRYTEQFGDPFLANKTVGEFEQVPNPTPTPTPTPQPTAPQPTAPTSFKTTNENDAKQQLYTRYTELINSGKDPDEAKALLAASEFDIGQDRTVPQFTTPKSNTALDTALYEKGVAGENMTEASQNMYGYMGKLRTRWDTSIKKNIDSLTNLAGSDTKYMEWLSNLGMDSNTMMRLSQGREGYINNYANEIRKNLNNDLVWLENLKSIKKEAEQDYLQKSKAVNTEIDRLKNNQDEVVWSGQDGAGTVSMIMRDSNTGKMYTKSFSGLGNKEQSNVLQSATDDNGNLTLILQKPDGSIVSQVFEGAGKKSTSGSSSSSAENIFTLSENARTDRNNNPITVAVTTNGKNQFTDALDKAGVKWSYGDPFPDNPSMSTIRFEGDPIEALRVVLSDTNAIQGWYLTRTGKDILAKYGVTNNEQFKKLSKDKQDDIIKGIYAAEGGSGGLMIPKFNNAQELANYAIKTGTTDLSNKSWWSSSPYKEEAWKIVQGENFRKSGSLLSKATFQVSDFLKNNILAPAKSMMDTVSGWLGIGSNKVSEQKLNDLIDKADKMYFNAKNDTQRGMIEATLKKAGEEQDVSKRIDIIQKLVDMNDNPDQWVMKSIMKDPLGNITGMLWQKSGTTETMITSVPGSTQSPTNQSSTPTSTSTSDYKGTNTQEAPMTSSDEEMQALEKMLNG